MMQSKIIVAGCVAVVLSGCSSWLPYSSSGPVADKGVKSCPDWSSNPVANYNNDDFSNLGCATGNNLYVQLKNPVDYEHGNGKAGISAARDSTALQGYLTGASAPSASASSSASR